MFTRQDNRDTLNSGQRSENIFKRFLRSLREIDDAIGYDPLENALERIRRLENEVKEIKLGQARTSVTSDRQTAI